MTKLNNYLFKDMYYNKKVVSRNITTGSISSDVAFERIVFEGLKNEASFPNISFPVDLILDFQSARAGQILRQRVPRYWVHLLKHRNR